MKELHHHIFSNTACISKETMLKYINNQLSDKEVHDIQKHLIDCEFCSEALEGMKYAQDSSVLFTIDHKVDLLAAGKKPPIIKNLMIAATFLVIAFGSYFTYTSFNEVIHMNESSISMASPTEESKEEVVPPAPELTEKLKAKEDLSGEQKNKQQEEVSGSSANQAPVLMDMFMEEDAEMEKEITVTESFEKAANEVPVTTISTSDESLAFSNDDYRSNDVPLETEKGDLLYDREGETQKLTEAITMDEMEPVMGNTTNRNVVSGKVLTKSTSMNSGKKDKVRAKKEAVKPRRSSDVEQDNIAQNAGTSIGGMLDSTSAPDVDKDANNAPGYYEFAQAEREENASDFKALEEDKTKSAASVLNHAIELYQNKEYEKALTQLEVLQQTNLTNENKVLWYKALCLIELDQTDKAKTILKTIISHNQTYVSEAKEKLAELK